MTWVVAFSGFPSGGIAAGDVRITFRDALGLDRHPDYGVQKVHEVARHTVVGFAGGIQAGFAAIEAARGHWSAAPSGVAVKPVAVARRLAVHMRAAWPSYAPEIRELGLQLLVLGWVPEPLKARQEISGPQGEALVVFDPSSPYTRSRVYVMDWPAFDVQEGADQAPIEIGSGSEVEVWGTELQRSLATTTGLDDRKIGMELGTVVPFIAVEWIKEAITGAMAKATDPYVSEYVQRFLVGPGGSLIAEPEAKPRIARSWEELQELGKRHGFAPTAAIA